MQETGYIMEYLKEQTEAITEEIIAIRREFHAHPELSEQEEQTAARISSYLTAWGIPHQTGIAGHGVVGLIQGTGPKTVAIRGDIDALPIQELNEVPYKSQTPGVMHACGHDIHTAVLLGAAKVLKGMENQLPGSVKLLFQPAEETVGGALPMIQAGCLEDPQVHAVIGLHVEPDVPAGALEFRRGSMNAASDEFTITVTGSSSHGARPQSGVDAILAASQIVSALQSISSRNVAPTDAVVVTVGVFQSGTAPNIVAGQAVLKGIVRTLNRKTRALAVRRVEALAQATAAAYGAAARVDFTESYPALINNDEIESILEKAAAAIFPSQDIFFRPEPSMGADDFSYFCDATPSAYFNIGTNSSPGVPAVPLHNETYCPSEDCIKSGILMEAAGAIAILKELTQRNAYV